MAWLFAVTMWLEVFRTRMHTRDLNHLRRWGRLIQDFPEPLRSQEHERIMKLVYANHFAQLAGTFTIDGWRRTY